MSAGKPRLYMGLGCLSVLATFLCTATSRAQDADDNQAGPKVEALGMEYFRHKLHEADLKPLRNWKEVFNDPQRTVIVLLGDRSIRQFLLDPARLAIEQGAAILIATDQSTNNTQLERYFSIHISGAMVDANPEDCDRRRPFHPFVRPFRAWRGLEADSPKAMFSELEGAGEGALATDHPSVLTIVRGRFPAPEPLAGYPFSARTRQAELSPETDLFAAGGFFVRGRYLVLADHSIFLNQMLLATSDGTNLLNSNLSFTVDCIDWLKGSQGRDRCLFVEDGQIKTDFKLSFPETEDSDLEKILKLLMFLEHNGNGNRIVSKLEDDNFFNKLLGTQVSTREIIRTLLIVLVCLSAFFAFWLTIRNRTSPDPAQVLVTPELAAMIPKGDVLRQRFNSLLEVENIYEAARDLIRDFLGGLNAEPDENGLPPKLAIEDGYEDEIQLRRKLGRLWRIAYAPEPVRVAPEEWKRIKEDLQEILTDADDGWWKFVKREQ